MKTSTIFTLSLLTMSMNTMANEYVPVVSKEVYLTRSNIKCNLAIDADSYKRRDWCDGSATIDIRLNVEQLRSVHSLTSEGITTPDAKIVRFTVDGQKPGTGIHLVNSLQQGHSWFGSWAHRNTYIGPFARSYNVWVKPVSGYIPKKANDFPNNENQNYQHRDTIGYSIGINGSVGAEVGKDGPKGSAEASGSFSYTNSKTLVFDTKEYRINNSSSLSDFNVSFERGFDKHGCDELFSQLLGCYFTSAHWGSGWVFDKSKFNPISYANFKPNFDVLYETPVSQKGTTDFEVGMGVLYQAYHGRVIPTPFYSVYDLARRSTGYSSVKQHIRIDWNHPLFAPEAHVTLQSLSDNNFCLDVYGTNNDEDVDVGGWECHGDWNQVWGLDDKERYRSRVAPQRCLAVLPDKSVTVDFCNETLTQKWIWEGDKLISRYVDGTNNRYALNIIGDHKVGVTPEGEATKAKWQPKLHKIKL